MQETHANLPPGMRDYSDYQLKYATMPSDHPVWGNGPKTESRLRCLLTYASAPRFASLDLGVLRSPVVEGNFCEILICVVIRIVVEIWQVAKARLAACRTFRMTRRPAAVAVET
ncbi:uncharacterized protein N7459_007279 [Penicillium hispanicum]|uniref:uncharacterized protein n=1 Tax=Penicillium hispanicum TaxID=1080232 RepID=UPI002540C070|nr:uncharacterized protein N7459_007279 [Penicillium hispanicum]KAJ5578315.1 hypothetical protein N7459_007279 [Penicillium hispanicum]